MAIYHVSAAGSNTFPYDTWDKAATTFKVGVEAASAGETIYVDSAHDETIGGTTSTVCAGTQASPCMILVGTHSGATGIDALATGARIQANAFTYSISGSFYCYGMVFYVTGAGAGLWQINNAAVGYQTYESCAFRGEGSSTAQDWVFGGASISDTVTIMHNCTMKFGNASQDWRTSGVMRLTNISVESGSTSPTLWMALNGTAGLSSFIEINGADLSNWGTAFGICDDSSTSDGAVLIMNGVKLPASWAGNLVNSAPALNTLRAQMLNYAIGTADTNYKFWVEDRWGRTVDETTVKLASGGAADETVSYSWKMTSLANVGYPNAIYRSPPIIKRQTAVAGGTRDVTVNIAHDGATAFTDKEVWVEVSYYGTSGFPLWTVTTDRALPTTAAAAQSTGSVTWTGFTDGVTVGPNGSTQWRALKLHVTGLTMAENGYVQAVVCMAVASKSIYVDPQMTIA